jgi:hypothetical protein
MQQLLEEILTELKAQTTILEKLAGRAEAQDRQTIQAKEALSRAAALLKGTPFEKILTDMGGRNGQ